MAKKIDVNPIRREIIAGKMERYGIGNEEMAVKMHMSQSKWFSLKKDPSGLELGQMSVLGEILHLDTEEIFRFATGIDFEQAFKHKAGRLGFKVLTG